MSYGRKKRPWLKLCMLKGSFSTADDEAGAAMDAEVWSKLPEELIWEVLRFLPAAAYFQLQTVSRKWREVLTSQHFRNTVSSSRQSEEEQEQQCVVACVANGYYSITKCLGDGRNSSASRRRSSRHSNCKLKMVDIDLSSFLPRCFWESGYFCVVAAADGLLCIADRKQLVNSETPQYCVLNPLTRTYKVLPPVPFFPREWLPPTPTGALAMFGYEWDEGRWQWELRVATYDLAAAASGTGGDGTSGWDWAAWEQGLAAHGYRHRPFDGEVAVAMCGGETFVFHHERLHVLARSPGGRLLVEVAALEQPSTRPGVLTDNYKQARLVAHRGTVFLVTVNDIFTPEVSVTAWRLARERLEWEVAARLDVGELMVRTGLMCSPVRKGTMKSTDYYICEWGLYRVRDFVYFTVGYRYSNCRRLILRLNLDTGAWELVHDDGERPAVDWAKFRNGLENWAKFRNGLGRIVHDDAAVNWAKFRNGLELRPDLFL